MTLISINLGITHTSIFFLPPGLTTEELHDLLTLRSLLGEERPKVKAIYNMEPQPGDKLPSARMAYLQRALQAFLNGGTGMLCFEFHLLQHL